MAMPLGYRHSPEARAKMSAAGRGRPKSDAHRAAISVATKNSPKRFRLDPEERGRRERLRRRAKTLKQYGITSFDYERLLEAQRGVCAICGDPPNGSFAVDHNHASGVVRGLLCRQCNLVVGNAREAVWILQSAAAYIKHHNTEGDR